MERIIYTIIFLIISNSLYSQDLSQLDKKNGFKGYKFGTQKSAFGDDLIKDNNRIGFAEEYKIKKQEYIGDIKVNVITLYFLNNKLAKIRLLFFSNSPDLREACTSAFGEPTGDNYDEEEKHSILHLYDSDELYWKGNQIFLTYTSSEDISGSDRIYTLEFKIK